VEGETREREGEEKEREGEEKERGGEGWREVLGEKGVSKRGMDSRPSPRGRLQRPERGEGKATTQVGYQRSGFK